MTSHHRRTGRARLLLGYLAIAAIVPYSLLKIAWIAGSTVGIASASPVDAAVVRGGNLVTVAMEVVAVVVILTFTHSWGLAVPAWLVLVPTWIGTGLLAPFVVTGPVVAVSVLGDPTSVGDGSLAAWVGPLVYLGFGAQAIGISAAFACYVRARWPRLLTTRTAEHPAGSARPVALGLVWTATVLLSIVAASRASWAWGSTWGLSAPMIANRGIAEAIADAGTALFAVAAAAGTLSLVHRRPRAVRTWVPLCLAWVGSGAVLGSGLYAMVLRLAGITGSGTVSPAAGLAPSVDLLQVLAGTVLAVVGAVLLAELDAAARIGSGSAPRRRRPARRHERAVAVGSPHGHPDGDAQGAAARP